ncbi:MAG: NAD(+) diphosphatase [Syntrophus sp. (in: bacteria)]|nr:NAD(+) diphosphatase [Syntrophus sp. (in: bacteria)]
MEMRFIPALISPPETIDGAWWFIFKGHAMLVMEDERGIAVPWVKNPTELGLLPLRERYLGTLDGRHCFCGSVAEDLSPPVGMALRGLRYLYRRVDETIHSIAMRAVHLIEWDRTVRYCSRCGTAMAHGADLNAKECPDCGFISFPRISPAVIVLVEREGKALLARGARFNQEIYSVLAGFVEPGETLEETVEREIEEEVGIQVANIRYFGSQPWPFPDSLMIAFIAEYAGGEIRIDKTEIVDAGWFDVDSLPQIPGSISIARKLIDWFVEKESISGGTNKTPEGH